MADVPTQNTAPPRKRKATNSTGKTLAPQVAAEIPAQLTQESEVTTPSMDGGKPDIKTIVAQASPTVEYAASRMRDIILGMIQALPQYIDDITRDFGVDLYQRMMLDPQTASTVDVVRMAALARGFPLDVPPKLDESELEVATEILHFCQWNLDNIEGSFKTFMWEMSASIYLGHKIAEIVWAVGEYPEAEGPRLNLKALKPKPQGSLAFVADIHNNQLGFIPALPGQYSAPTFIAPAEDGKIPNLLPRKGKFAVAVHDPEDGNPLGKSRLRRIYTQWYMGRQVEPEYLMFLSTHAVPPYWGMLGPDAGEVEEEVDGEPTGEMIDPLDNMEQALEALRNGGVIALPNGASVGAIELESKGEAFIAFFQYINSLKAKGITGQTLATEEAEHMARAASVTHQDILALPVTFVTEMLANMLHDDILYYVVLYNYGEEAARRYTPVVKGPSTEMQDVPTMLTAYATMYEKGMVEEDQLPAIHAVAKLPPTDMDARAKRLEEKEAQAQKQFEQELNSKGGFNEQKDGKKEDPAGSAAGRR